MVVKNKFFMVSYDHQYNGYILTMHTYLLVCDFP
jgi:hypothetical protein